MFFSCYFFLIRFIISSPLCLSSSNFAGHAGTAALFPLQVLAVAAFAVVSLLLQPLGVDAVDEFLQGSGAHGVARAADVENAGNGGPGLVRTAEDADPAAVQRHAQPGEFGVEVGH